jgi:hypothetical protein
LSEVQRFNIEETFHKCVSPDLNPHPPGLLRPGWTAALAGRGNARDNKKARIIAQHLQVVIRNDEELGKLLAGVTISRGGVLPNINPVLLPKKSWKKEGLEVQLPFAIILGNKYIIKL